MKKFLTGFVTGGLICGLITFGAVSYANRNNVPVKYWGTSGDIKIYSIPNTNERMVHLKGDYISLADEDKDGIPDTVVAITEKDTTVFNNNAGFKSLEDIFQRFTKE